MTRKTPDHLVARLLKLADDFEAHYRADERLKIFTDLRAALGVDHADIYGTPQQSAQTDMHGEPVAGTESPKPATSNPDFWKNYQRPLSTKHREMVSIMSKGRFVALPTIAGLVKLKTSTVQQYLYDLADHGYEIESKAVNVRYGKRGYRKIYRIASGE